MPLPRSNGEEVHRQLMETRRFVKRAKEEAGRSEMGRRWAIILTKLEELDAVLVYYVAPNAVDEMAAEAPSLGDQS